IRRCTFVFFQAEDGIRYWSVTGVQTCALPIFAGPGDPSTWLAGVDTRTIRGYLAHLHARSLDSTTIARKLAAVRSWFRFLVRRGVLERNVAREVRGPRPPRKLVSFLPIDEATALMDA